MTVRKWFLALVIFFVAPIVSHASEPGDAFLHLIEGDVQMTTADNQDWVPAASNTPLFEGDKLWVPYDGRAEIRVNDGTSARLAYGAALEIGPPEEEGHHLYLDQGRCYVNFPGSGGRPLTIDAPDASIRVYGAAVFKIDAPEDGETVVSVLVGAVSVGAQAEQIDLQAGERLILRDRGAFPDVARLAPDDEWGRWNRERDREVYGSPKSYSAQYLPEDLRAYASDFDRNGTWERVPTYGRVWVPATVASPGWSPYRIGRWVWMRGDYVWVSYEPWGWAPYHYGRWAYVGRVGWCWVPPSRGAAYWAPGYVGWVYTGTLVSWVPLAPREIYYGRGHHGPDSVDTTRAIDRRSGPDIRYRNVNVRNAVTTINRDAFLTGRGTAPARAGENPFLKQRPSYGAPPIKPVRTTLMPIVRDIPPAKRPPERIREAQSFAPVQNEGRRGPQGPAPSGRKGPGPVAPSEQKGIGSPIARPPMPAQGPANVGRPGGPPVKQEDTHETRREIGNREPARPQGGPSQPGPAASGPPTGPQRDLPSRRTPEEAGKGGTPQTTLPPAQRDQRPPSTGPVAPSGQQVAPPARTPDARQGTPLGQPGRETMGGPVGGQPQQGRPGIAPRQGQAQVPGPAGQTPPGTTRVDGQGRMERKAPESLQPGQPPRTVEGGHPAPAGQGTGTGSMREAPPAKAPELQRRTEPTPSAPPQPAPQVQSRPAPQPAPTGPPSRPAPQVEARPQPVPQPVPAPQSAPRVQPVPAPQAEPRPAPQPGPVGPPRVTPQVQARPVPQVAPGGPSRPAPQIEPRPAPQPMPAPAPRVQPIPAPQPAPQVQSRPAPSGPPSRPAPQVEARPQPVPRPAPAPPPAPRVQPVPTPQAQPKGPGGPADKGRQSTQKEEKERERPGQSEPAR